MFGVKLLLAEMCWAVGMCLSVYVCFCVCVCALGLFIRRTSPFMCVCWYLLSIALSGSTAGGRRPPDRVSHAGSTMPDNLLPPGSSWARIHIHPTAGALSLSPRRPDRSGPGRGAQRDVQRIRDCVVCVSW